MYFSNGFNLGSLFYVGQYLYSLIPELLVRSNEEGWNRQNKHQPWGKWGTYAKVLVENLKVGNHFKEQRRMLPVERRIKKELKGTGCVKRLWTIYVGKCVCIFRESLKIYCVHTARKLYWNVDCNATTLHFIDIEVLSIIVILI